MADGGYGRGPFDWLGYFKLMGFILLAAIIFVTIGELLGFLH